MGCMSEFHDWCWDLYNEGEDKDKQKFISMKKGFNDSLNDINSTLDTIDGWQSLFDPEDELLNKWELILNPDDKYSNNEGNFKIKKCSLTIYFICGWFFCFFQLIGVQAGMIILNAIFNEIVDEIMLYRTEIQRESNFYQNIEIASYKSVPEIDFGMAFWVLGTSFLKKYGYYWSNIFQLLSLIGFLLLFLLFDFHINEELSKNYTSLEMAVLIIMYIFLCIFVGASSNVAFKVFFDSYKVYYKNYYDIWDFISFRFCLRKLSKSDIKITEESDDDNLEKFLMFLFSVLSAASIIGLNRLIFFFIKDITSTKLLISILMVYIGSSVLSFILFCFYSIPEEKFDEHIKKYEKTQNKINEDNYKEKVKIEQVDNENLKSLENVILYNKIDNQENIQNKIEEQQNNNLQTKKEGEEDIEIIDIKSLRTSCTCLGYVYFQKTINNKNVCIFYDYDSCCSWFYSRIRRPEIFAPLISEVFLQLSYVGFNSIFSDKLSKEYSISENIKFCCFLLIDFIILGLYIIILRTNNYKDIFSPNIISLDYGNNNKYKSNFYSLIVIIGLLFFFSIFVIVYSLMYICEKNPDLASWNKRFEGEILIFKFFDLQILSYFDFIDDKDCLNSSIFITVEKVIWMGVETLLEILEVKIKTLFIIQIVSSGIFTLLLIFIIIFLIMDASKICGREKAALRERENKRKKEEEKKNNSNNQ